MRAVFSIACFLLLRGLTNFLLQIVIAAHYGATQQADTYFVVIGLVTFLAELIAGVITFALLPIQVRVRAERGAAVNWEVSSTIITVTGICIICTTLIMALGAPLLIRLLAPGFSPIALSAAVELTRIGSIAFACYAGALLIGCILQANEMFTTTAIAPTLPLICTFFAAFLLPNTWGGRGLILGFTAGSAIAITMQVAQLGFFAGAISLRPRLTHPHLARAWSLIIPVVVAYLCPIVLTVVLRMRASHLAEGSIAALGYGQTIVGIPIALIVAPLATVLFPRFSLHLKQGQLSSIAGMVKESIVALVLAAALAGALLGGLAPPLVELLLKRGNFTSQDAATTASVLRTLAAGLFVVTASNMLGRVICVVGKVRHYAVSWLITVAFFLLLLLFNEQTPQAQELSSLGAALSLAYGCHAVLAFILLVREIPGTRLRPAFAFSARLMLAMFASGKASEWLAHLGAQIPLVDHPTTRIVMGLILGGLGGTGLFIALIMTMKGEEVRIMMTAARQLSATRRPMGIVTHP